MSGTLFWVGGVGGKTSWVSWAGGRESGWVALDGGGCTV